MLEREAWAREVERASAIGPERVVRAGRPKRESRGGGDRGEEGPGREVGTAQARA